MHTAQMWTREMDWDPEHRPSPPILADEKEITRHRKKEQDADLDIAVQTLVPQPRSFFMDVKCPGCFTITTVFSHAQTVVICAGCSTVLCQPTGGKARLTEGCSFRRK